MIAIYFGSSEVVDILLRSGADVNITDLVSWYIQLNHKLSSLLLFFYFYYCTGMMRLELRSSIGDRSTD